MLLTVTNHSNTHWYNDHKNYNITSIFHRYTVLMIAKNVMMSRDMDPTLLLNISKDKFLKEVRIINPTSQKEISKLRFFSTVISNMLINPTWNVLTCCIYRCCRCPVKYHSSHHIVPFTCECLHRDPGAEACADPAKAFCWICTWIHFHTCRAGPSWRAWHRTPLRKPFQ